MRQEKLDPALQIALHKGGERFDVFLHTASPLDANSLARLQIVNVSPLAPEAGIHSGNLSRSDIESLSGEDWVNYIRLSRPMRKL